ncbi:MAG: hypothetical protein DSZ11_01785 [Sulfurovum sp.]|nr:MAG: hypothetical protein DSZ11_01785 [Sulfurovum sp.]
MYTFFLLVALYSPRKRSAVEKIRTERDCDDINVPKIFNWSILAHLALFLFQKSKEIKEHYLLFLI